MKINELKIGDKVRYLFHGLSEDGFIQSESYGKNGFSIIDTKTIKVGTKIRFVYKEDIISKLEPVTSEKEVPIERHFPRSDE